MHDQQLEKSKYYYILDISMLREIHKLVVETILPKFTDFKYPTDEEIEYLISQLPKDLRSKKKVTLFQFV